MSWGMVDLWCFAFHVRGAGMVAASELNVNERASATAMANTIFGDGATVVGASYTGDWRSSGTYSGGDSNSPGVVPGDDGVILSTGRAADFTNSYWNANWRSNTSTNTRGENGNDGFDDVAGGNTYDASYLDVDFIPTNDVMTMQFVFSSEEYPEYINSIYNDIVAVWVNGDYVEMAVGDGTTGVSTVNEANTSNLYVDNTSSQYNTEMDGFTLTMSLTFPVSVGVVNSIRIGIADTSDSSYDSNLLIAGDSLQTTLIATEDEFTIAPDGTKTVDVLANDVNLTGGVMEITHINGVAVNVGDTVILGTGQEITLNSDGTFEIVNDADEEVVNFTYEIESANGNTSVGIVTLDTIPCFVSGTMILTADGEKPVEDLIPGDLILTQDDGPQPLRWIGRRSMPAIGKMAPISIRAGALGDHRELLVSPLHRVLIRDVLSELLFGEREVLVAARDLINDHSIRVIEGGEVTYVHLLFDRHQVVFSEGLPTESFLPGPQTTQCFEADVVDEICTIFPELDPMTGEGYSPAARRTLRKFEAQVLLRTKQMVA